MRVSLPSWRQFASSDQSEQSSHRRLLPLVGLAAFAWLVEMLDGATGVLMMQRHGYTSELNPLVRAVFHDLGPIPVMLLLKVGPSTLVLVLFLYLSRKRRVLARNALFLALLLGAVGVWSNLG
jgi:hypothetical protein